MLEESDAMLRGPAAVAEPSEVDSLEPEEVQLLAAPRDHRPVTG